MTTQAPRTGLVVRWTVLGVAAALAVVWIMLLVEDPTKPSRWLGLVSMAMLIVSNVIGLRKSRRDVSRLEEP
ncbi:hypothetical protein V6N00_04515 [Tersicoccus sp. MR15.9]|uniref:hypothetical protein n=1 Tax=Tersicoccus mangrovi TaxID=3121635 RepID=UPI002FE56E2E